MIGEIYGATPKSGYQPSEEVRAITAAVQKDYFLGDQILNRPYVELNNRSVIDDENHGQMMANAFVDEDVEDPNEAWKWRGTRSYARNKGIVMHANLTAHYLLPLFLAQNENDDVDQDYSEIMRDIIEWMASPTNSNYQSSFLQVVSGAISNPVTYLGAEYCEVFQTIREKSASGKYTTKEILDEVLSGFKCPVLSSTQVLITNAYERNIQKQRRIIKRNYAEKEELEAKYGEHQNWQFVFPGIKSIYNDETDLFYDVKDTDTSRQYLCVEEIALSRRDDSEIPFVNGIYLGAENVEENPICHRDNRNAPKYNIVPFGFHRIGQHFFYYKSMMNAMRWDNNYYDAMSEVIMNRAVLELEMPVAVSGTDKVDTDIIFPNSVISFEDKDTKITRLLPEANMGAGFNVLRETEKSMNEGSVNETVSGDVPDTTQTAYTVSQAQAAAKTLIRGVGKSIAESVMMYGDLMKDIAINNVTVPQVDELVSGAMKLRYRSFLLGEKSSGGKKMDKYIKFNADLIGKEMTEDEKNSYEMKMLEESGYPDHKMSLVHVNPERFAKFKYLCKVDVEEMFTKNAEYWQPVLSGLVQQMAQNPYVDMETLTRKLMYAYFQSGAEDVMKKQPIVPPQAMNGGQPVDNTNPVASAVQAKRTNQAANSFVA